ncbi:MAG TPA: PAS domain-containing protein [Gemmatimonadales bacterium]|nr:PAS domain-containing protein [Gemmatimonadales bacterium]
MDGEPSTHDQEATLRELAGPLLSALSAGTLAPQAGYGSPPPEVMERLTEARYRTMLEQIPAVTFMAALQHGLQELYVSPQIESLLGYTQQEWLQDPVLWYERLHPDDKDRWNVEFARTIAFGERFHSIYRFIARDGRIVWILGDTKIVRDDAGNPLFIQGVGFDITELKDAEEMLRQRTIDLDLANKELEAFAYSVTHDLRTPLRTLEAFSQILVQDFGGKLGDTGKHYLDLVRGSASRMAQMIDDFLSLYRISRKTVDRTWVDLSAMARMILRELKDAEPHRVVDVRIEHTRPAHVDAALFRIALGNLLGNAWKFTSKLAHATIEFGETVRDDRPVYFVRDNGAGFDMAYADKLFRPFERLHTTEEFSGHGIGLATIRRVVERHGGHVFAEGEVGRGATFFFSAGS